MTQQNEQQLEKLGHAGKWLRVDYTSIQLISQKRMLLDSLMPLRELVSRLFALVEWFLRKWEADLTSVWPSQNHTISSMEDLSKREAC